MHIQGSGLTIIQRNAVDMVNKEARAREEQQLLIGEMKQFLASQKQKNMALSKCLVNMLKDRDVTQQQRGLRHLISIKLMKIEGQHDRAAFSHMHLVSSYFA